MITIRTKAAMNIKNNGLFKFDYQIPVYNFFFPSQGKCIIDKPVSDVIVNSNNDINSRALYFHIPFCETICTFCPFTKGGYKGETVINNYTDALIKEIELKANFVDYQAVPVRAIFFGGGTPSLLSPSNILKIGEAIHKHFKVASNCEFSFEIEIKSLTEEKVIAMKEIGVTHPRFGLQTFNQEWRKLFNLTSTYEHIKFAASILNANFKYVLFDILYGMNGQDEEEIIKDLEMAVSLGTSNIDIYPIDNVVTQVKLHKAIKNRGLGFTTATRKFSMNMLIDAYMRSKGFMPHNGHGYIRTPNVTSDIVTDEYSFVYHEHVYGYSDFDLHGFGVNAVTSIREHVITNFSNRNAYITAVNSEKMPANVSKHSPILDEIKPIILRLPYHGLVNKSLIKMDFVPKSIFSKLDILLSNDLIVENNDSWQLTKLGWYWYINIMFWLMPEEDQRILKAFIAEKLNETGRFIAKKELVYV